MEPTPLLSQPVPRGPLAYRARLRNLGPFAGLLPPAAMGGVAMLLLHENHSTVRGVMGFLLAVMAAPGLLVAGAPLATGGIAYPLAVAGSVAMWLLLGLVAARKATDRPAAVWADFWRELLWLAGAVWVGVVGALLAANLLMGRALL